MSVHVRMRRQRPQVRVQYAFAHQVFNARALQKRTRQTHVRTTHQRRCARLFQTQQRTHLRMQTFVRERVRRELVTKEVGNEFFAVGDGIEHGGPECGRAPRDYVETHAM